MNFKFILESILLEATRIEFLKEKFVDSGKITEKEFNFLLDNDPTPNKKYLQVLIKWLLPYKKETTNDIDKRKNELSLKIFFEDLISKTKYNLELHDRVPNKFKHADITQYPSIENFNSDGTIVRNSVDELTKEKGKKKSEVYDKFKIGETKSFNIYKIPKQRFDLYPVSKYFASGTEWCTKGSDRFSEYISSDDLFIFISKTDLGRKYQLHPSEPELADKDDTPLLVRDVPEYDKIIAQKDLCELINSIPRVKMKIKNFISEYENMDDIKFELSEFHANLIEECMDDVVNEVKIKFKKTIKKASEYSFIRRIEPEIYHYCETVLNLDMVSLMNSAEDMSSVFEWEDYNEQALDDFVREGIDKCVMERKIIDVLGISDNLFTDED